MTEIHKVVCDKCGEESEMIKESSYSNCYDLPLFWKNIEKNWIHNADLCPKCKKKFKEHSKEFFK